MNGIIGRKLGMTQLFAENGTLTGVTVIEAGPCPVVQVRKTNSATKVQLGFGSRRPKNTSKAEAGHAKKAGLAETPRILREFAFAGDAPEPGTMVTVAAFTAGEQVKVTGTSKGRGFQGVVHRWGFRKPGSIGPGTDPSRVIKGKKMPGHMGARQRTQIRLVVMKVDAERNLLYVQGSVPGSMNGIVTVRKQNS